MDKKYTRITKRELVGGIIGLILIAGTVGFTEYRNQELVRELRTIEADVNTRSEAQTAQLAQLETLSSGTQTQLSSLLDVLKSQETKSSEFEQKISAISSTVGTLDKLRNTDKELLMKYSKTYFLNEHYVPFSLSNIGVEYLYGKTTPLQIHSSVWPHLKDLLEDAQGDDVDIKIVSAYRSFERQAALKSAYTITYGSGANTFSADQGYSEHQLGTTVDITTPSIGALKASFDGTTAYKWMDDHAHEYGFVLSYPKNNKFYIYEPWHWRFVGIELATKLHNENKHLYDLEQREIDTYLVNIFD